MTKPQTTIAKKIEFSGKGIHSGIECHICIQPEEADAGIYFVRSDLPGQPAIPASIQSLTEEPLLRQTVLQSPDNESASVQTVEHILACLHAYGIDNARIEMTSGEAPILNGSAAELARMLAECGGARELAGTERRLFEITRPVAFQPGESDSIEFAAWPSRHLIVTYFLEYEHPVIGSQAVSFRIGPDVFREAIAPARTFCTSEEVEFLRSRNLIRGGNENNAIIVGPDSILNTELLWPDELARHKLLDLLGDLLLVGAPLRGHILSYRGGHHANAMFIKHLRKEFDAA
ncbi:MAG: UDP-3-O-acyl-N-acetylglucosamine deacetylase [Candidatus Sumerlaeia bacterium]